MVSDIDARVIVAGILREKFPGLIGFDVAQDVDHAGAPILRVKARFSQPLNDFDPLFDSVTSIRERLLAAGDDRYVFVTPEWPGSDEDTDEDLDDEGDDSSEERRQ